MIEGTFARPGAAAAERAGEEFRRALLRGDSALTPGMAIWTLPHAQELLAAFNGQPDVTGASFDDKLRGQLQGVSPDAVQLFAELYCIDLLPLSDYKSQTKRALVASTLAIANLAFPLPEIIDQGFSRGVLNGGVAFKTRRYWQLCYLVEFAAGFLGMSPEERARLLAEPLAFREALGRVTSTNSPSQKAALLYLLFPNFFLPIAKTEHRALIRKAFADLLEQSSGDQDTDLRDIYAILTRRAGGHVDLYSAPYRQKWDPKASASTGRHQTPWQLFMSWAARLAGSVDLEVEERSYKLEMARRLAAARDSMLAGDTDWTERLKGALSYRNLLDRYYKTDLFNALSQHPEQIRDAFVRYWTGQPDPAQLPTLYADLRSIAPTTPGNATAIGSVLLMARDSTQFPPYRPTPVAKARALTGTPSSGTSPAERYDDLLTLCDEVLERAADAGVELQDRLDAQGLIWAVVSYLPPSAWSEADRKAFLSWRGDAASSDEPPTQRAWLVRGSSVNGRDFVPDWLHQGYVSVLATNLREVEAGITREELKPIVDEDYAHASYAAKADKLDELYNFLSRMLAGHLVATVDQERLYIGEITGDATYAAAGEGQGRLIRSVAWATAGSGIPVEEVPGELKARLTVQRDVLDVTQQLEVLERLLAAKSTQAPPPTPVDVVLRDATPALAKDLYVDRQWLQECIDLLNDRRQLIFYGPPGTGKTYLARAIAKHVAGDNVRLVQLHPAYSYEDFFEGYRPTEAGGFALKPGPMRRIVDQAVRSPTVAHMLIIDEINRGNLAKVFGELYFLLEYRDNNVELLYADGDFSLPKNVYIIGTMNTADRSIALVDAAMRRRFAFIPLHPTEPPTNGVLRLWLADRQRPQRVADLLDELNRRIADPDFKIGPSYFMRDAIYGDGGLERAWRTSILPLLEEHHYGELAAGEVAARYGLASIEARVERATDPDEFPAHEVIDDASTSPPD